MGSLSKAIDNIGKAKVNFNNSLNKELERLEGLRIALKNQAQERPREEYNMGECKNELEYLKRKIRKIERRWLD